jgi:hypothetical protein
VLLGRACARVVLDQPCDRDYPALRVRAALR